MFELNKFEIISKYYDLFHIASGLKAKDAREQYSKNLKISAVVLRQLSLRIGLEFWTFLSFHYLSASAIESRRTLTMIGHGGDFA